jgi:phospholipid/cholesterol/gamma-HCH transport system substrate-binding protein
MEKNSRYFIIGVFVSLSLLALTMFIVWLAGTHDTRNYKNYTIYFRDPVSGLKTSAVVQYRGVDVGRVKDVRISPTEKDLIKVDIEVDDATPITKSSEASLATQGVTGLVFIDLTTKEGDQSPPERIQGEEFAVIKGRGTQLSKLFQDIPAITSRILTLTEKLNTVFDEENVASMDQTLKNIAQATSDLNALLSEENIQNTTLAIQNVSQSSAKVNDLVARFDKTADQIDQAVNSLNSVLTDNKANIDKFAGSGLKEITQMTAETREMAKSIRRLADTLEQEPSRLLYQPNYRGVEIQK